LSLVRELREFPEKVAQQQMTAAVQMLFHLQTPPPALAGTKSREERQSWPEKPRPRIDAPAVKPKHVQA
jgi:hypothetical protein